MLPLAAQMLATLLHSAGSLLTPAPPGGLSDPWPQSIAPFQSAGQIELGFRPQLGLRPSPRPSSCRLGPRARGGSGLPEPPACWRRGVELVLAHLETVRRAERCDAISAAVEHQVEPAEPSFSSDYWHSCEV